MSERRSFDAEFQDDSDQTFFLHDVDQDTGLLHVRVLDCGLSKTFIHQASGRALQTLDKKTTGFLAAVAASSKRVVLAWAESGHGQGRRGDPLRAKDHVLSNTRWASRAIKLAAVLDIDLSSPFDKPTTPQGSFQAAHVEVKLATHAAMLLLHLTKEKGARVTEDTLTRENLFQLRNFRWSNGDPLHFEVYVSRKNCTRCGAFLKKLQALTGVRFDLRSGTRVVPIQYHKQQLKAAAQLGLHRSDAQGDQQNTTTTALPTYEKDGIIHYMPLEEEVNGEEAAPPRASTPIRISPHHLSDVEKPLPATPVLEAPDMTSSDAREVYSEDASDDNLPFPSRSPRPYGMRFG